MKKLEEMASNSLLASLSSHALSTSFLMFIFHKTHWNSTKLSKISFYFFYYEVAFQFLFILLVPEKGGERGGKRGEREKEKEDQLHIFQD